MSGLAEAAALIAVAAALAAQNRLKSLVVLSDAINSVFWPEARRDALRAAKA